MHDFSKDFARRNMLGVKTGSQKINLMQLGQKNKTVMFCIYEFIIIRIRKIRSVDSVNVYEYVQFGGE